MVSMPLIERNIYFVGFSKRLHYIHVNTYSNYVAPVNIDMIWAFALQYNQFITY